MFVYLFVSELCRTLFTKLFKLWWIYLEFLWVFSFIFPFFPFLILWLYVSKKIIRSNNFKLKMQNKYYWANIALVKGIICCLCCLCFPLPPIVKSSIFVTWKILANVSIMPLKTENHLSSSIIFWNIFKAYICYIIINTRKVWLIMR